MPLEWFGSPKGPSVGQLIARKKFAKAIEVLREQLGHEAGNPRVRMQLADVLVMAGSPQEASPVLLSLADDFAAQGQGAKAIAVLKKLQKIEPGRTIDRRLAALIKDTRGAPRLSTERARQLQAPEPVYGATINDGPVTATCPEVQWAVFVFAGTYQFGTTRSPVTCLGPVLRPPTHRPYHHSR